MTFAQPPASEPDGSAAPAPKKVGQLSDVQIIVGLFAGLAAAVYVTGGFALALRLWWAGLPALTVGQLPRDVLFSVGVAQVVLPALCVGVVVGLFELAQQTPKLRAGHLVCADAKRIGPLRTTYRVFYAAMPLVIISPGTALAVGTHRGEDTPLVVAILAVAVVALLTWARFARRSRRSARERAMGDTTGDMGVGEWALIILPGVLLTGLLAWIMHSRDDGLRYIGVVGAWAVALPVALLAVWLRGQIGNRSREGLAPDHPARRDAWTAAGPRLPESSDDVDVPPRLVVGSWCATAVLCAPAFIALAAASPLTAAVVCAEQIPGSAGAGEKQAYAAAGGFVGESKDRVYIGVGHDSGRRLVSVPTSGMSRLVVGHGAADVTACENTQDPKPDSP